VQGRDGVFYGTTEFGRQAGGQVYDELARAKDGNFYGTTTLGELVKLPHTETGLFCGWPLSNQA
jgi:hypothetical protein